jgi:hypothetical protein
MITLNFRLVTLPLGLIALGLGGCASTTPKPEFSHEIIAEAHIASPDTTAVSVDAPESVKILPAEKDRLAQKIQLKIDARKVSNIKSGTAKSYAVELHLTRYEKGSAFGRAILAGLGQIHIDGKVDVFQMPAHTLVGEFDLKKTFAWGGIYGATTSMEDIEMTFADGVAATVTGQKEEPAKSKT